MVQEFHVLKCYSCETFQVQQVKKCKKWNCKMCGEKQSLIKEFGRGSGVDCRRHVQKLNARRGELLEVHVESALSEREETLEDVGDSAPKYDSQNAEKAVESRWGKFLPQPGEGQGDEETEEEEEEGVVDLGINLHNGKRSVRKRKRGSGRSNVASGYLSEENDYHQRSTAERIMKVQHNQYSNSFTPMETSPKCLTSTSSSVPAYNRQPAAQKPSPPELPQPKPYVTGASNRFNRVAPSTTPGTTTTPASSKWAQFLSPPSPEEEDEGWTSLDQSGTTGSFVKPVSRVGPAKREDDYETSDAGAQSCGSTSSLGGLGSSDFLQRNIGGTYNRLKTTLGHCGFGQVTNRKREPVPMFSGVERKEPVCDQPRPTKRPSPFLSVGSLFNTGEDFDVDDFENHSPFKIL